MIHLFGNTADACFAVDGEQRVVLWNQGAESLLGYRAQEVIGRRCFQVIRSSDAQGRTFCRHRCLLRGEAIKGRLVASRRLALQAGAGQRRTVEMGTVIVPSEDPGGPYLVHYLWPTEKLGDTVPPSPQPLPTHDNGSDLLSHLTPREYQVLALLARGATTDQVAEELTITRTTARNHIQRILNKLTVHTRLEAMVLARQHRLFPSS